MRLFGFEITRAKEGRVVQGNGTSWLNNILQMWGAEGRGAAPRVTEDSALTISAVYTAVRIISGTMSSLALHVFRQNERGREFAFKHWAYPLLKHSPNDYHTRAAWMRIMMAHLLLWGNSYNRIEWLNNGKARGLWPLMPWYVEPLRVKEGQKIWLGTRWAEAGEQVYQHETEQGREFFGSDEILHVYGPSLDGMKGISPVRYMSEMLGTAKAMDTFTGAFFRNGAKPGAILETPGRMNETAQRNLAKSIQEEFGSASDAFKVLVLEQGAKMHTYSMPLKDAQLLEGRKLSRAEIYGLFGIPPHLGGDTERQTTWGTGLAEMDVGYAKHTITPLCEMIEQELNRKLFGRGALEYAKFNVASLERGDFKSRMESYATAVGGPFLTREEVRDLEDWPMSGEPGADKILTPLNMGVGATPPQPEPKPAGGTDGKDDDPE